MKIKIEKDARDVAITEHGDKVVIPDFVVDLLSPSPAAPKSTSEPELVQPFPNELLEAAANKPIKLATPARVKWDPNADHCSIGADFQA